MDELGDSRALPVTVAATVLTRCFADTARVVDEEEAPEAARYLLDQTEREEMTAREKANLIDIVTSIMVYKFANLSRAEIRAMLGLNLTEEPRAIREAKEEGREEGRQAEALSLVIRLLIRRLRQELSEEMRSRLTTLSLPVLEELSEALLDFTTLSDLEHWLAEHG